MCVVIHEFLQRLATFKHNLRKSLEKERHVESASDLQTQSGIWNMDFYLLIPHDPQSLNMNCISEFY